MPKHIIGQLISFAICGFIATLVDVGFLVVFNEMLNIDVMLSSALSFSISVTVNYFLSMRFVFRGGNMKKSKEFIIFVILSIGGLLLNQAIMWIGTSVFAAHYLIAKLVSVILVPAYNFISKKMLLER